MPRYVILTHDHPFLHWDFMLEAGAVLRTWRLAEQPRPGAQIVATPIGDHRPAYLDYEGPLSGNRGAVTQWDCGHYALLESTDQRHVIRLVGKNLTGIATLTQIGSEWTFHFSSEVTEG